MGGCINKAFPEAQQPARFLGPKRFDVFIAHHEACEDDGSTDNFSSQFADWIEELCKEIGLKVLYDKTNLGRILEEQRMRIEIPACRTVVAIINREALRDQHGMQQELWWAHNAKMPIIPFYDGDKYSAENYASWQKKNGYALQRPPVVYKRRAHMQTKDSLVVAINDALQETNKGPLPKAMLEHLAKQEVRQKRRERRVEHQRAGEIKVSSAVIDSATTSKADAKWSLPPSLDFPEVAAGQDPELQNIRIQEQNAASGPKQFRFRDDALLGKQEDGPKGVKKLLKSLQDPFGAGEQDLRTAILQGRENAGEEYKSIPRHRTLQPLKSCLKKSTSDAPVRPAPAAPVAAPQDPRLQKGVARLMEYLQTVNSKDVTQLPTVLRVLELAVPSEDVAKRALAIIFDFVQGSEQCRRVVVQQSGIKHTVMGMATHTQSLDLNTFACGILYALSCFRPDNPEKDNNSAAIAHAGGITRLVDAMNTFPTCLEVQQFAAGALRHLAVEMRGNNRRQMSSGGEVQLTMRGINKRMIAKTGGIEMIAKAMAKFPRDYELQENGCAALSNLTTTSIETKVRAARAGCIRSAVGTMRYFPQEPDLQQMACHLLRSLAQGVPENKIAIVAQGGVRQLCQAMANHRDDVDVNIEAIAALTNLTMQLPENKSAVCTSGGLELTVAALQAQPGHVELQSQGLGLLYNLCCDQSLQQQVTASAAPQVADAACAHSDPTVQKLGKMLYKQMHGESKKPANATSDNEKSKGKDDVDGLFAARRPGQAPTATRNKTLSKMQRKVMAEAMASIRQEPNDWLSGDSSGTSRQSSRADSERKQKSVVSSGASSGGGWDEKRKQHAAEYGIQDLEGLSDDEEAPNRSDFVVRRGIARQASTSTPRQSSPNTPRDDSSFGVSRKGRKDQSAAAPGDTKSTSHIQDMGLFARRGAGNRDPAKTGPANATLRKADLAPAEEPISPGISSTAPLAKAGEMMYPWEVATRDAHGTPALTSAIASHDGENRSASPRKEDDRQMSEVMSVVSSEASGGGMIDLMDDNAAARIQRRARREKRREARNDKGNATNEGAEMLREFLNEVELENVPPPPQNTAPKPKMTKEQKKFMKALKKIGETAPERDNDEWKEVLVSQYEANKGTMASRALRDTAVTAGIVLDKLDGLSRAARQKREALKNSAVGVGTIAIRVRSEGLVHVVQTSKLARRFKYGIEDDEESIYDLDDLGQIGDAEAALLDAIGEAADTENDKPASGPRAAGQQETSPDPQMGEKLEAASKRLAQKRQERRLVQLL